MELTFLPIILFFKAEMWVKAFVSATCRIFFQCRWKVVCSLSNEKVIAWVRKQTRNSEPWLLRESIWLVVFTSLTLTDAQSLLPLMCTMLKSATKVLNAHWINSFQNHNREFCLGRLKIFWNWSIYFHKAYTVNCIVTEEIVFGQSLVLNSYFELLVLNTLVNQRR